MRPAATRRVAGARLLAAVQLQFMAGQCVRVVTARSSCATISVTRRRGRSEASGAGRDAEGGTPKQASERHHGGQRARMRMHGRAPARQGRPVARSSCPTNSIQFLPNAGARVHPGCRWGVRQNPWRPPELNRPFGREENHGAVYRAPVRADLRKTPYRPQSRAHVPALFPHPVTTAFCTAMQVWPSEVATNCCPRPTGSPSSPVPKQPVCRCASSSGWTRPRPTSTSAHGGAQQDAPAAGPRAPGHLPDRRLHLDDRRPVRAATPRARR